MSNEYHDGKLVLVILLVVITIIPFQIFRKSKSLVALRAFSNMNLVLCQSLLMHQLLVAVLSLAQIVGMTKIAMMISLSTDLCTS